MNRHPGTFAVLTPIRHLFVIALVISAHAAGLGQGKGRGGSAPEAEGDKKVAKDNFSMGNFAAAIPEFKALLKEYPASTDLNYKLAVCYLESAGDKSRAIPHLEIVTGDPKHPAEALFYLGKAYQHAHLFDEAVRNFEKYKEQVAGKPELVEDAEREIASCRTARKLIAYPASVRFENLGKMINTDKPEYNPYVPADESFLVYTTKVKTSGGMDGGDEITGEIFYTTIAGGKWKRGRSIGGGINTDLTEESAGMTSDGGFLFVAIDNVFGYGDLYMSRRQGRGFRPAEPAEKKVINSPSYESSATMNPDQDIVIFSSDRDGGQGGMDLYMTKRLPNGGWGTPINLGPKINTKYNEEYPWLSADGLTLYFSSTGHNTMGGYDIFKTPWDGGFGEFGEPQNLGYPINTTEDEKTICFDGTGRYAYMARNRKDGFGDLDIYRLTLEDVEPRYTVIKGLVTNRDSSLTGAEGVISVYDQTSDEQYGVYAVRAGNGKYIIILPPGRWRAEVEMDGYSVSSEEIVVKDMADYVPEIRMNFTVGKVRIGEK